MIENHKAFQTDRRNLPAQIQPNLYWRFGSVKVNCQHVSPQRALGPARGAKTTNNAKKTQLGISRAMFSFFVPVLYALLGTDQTAIKLLLI